MGHGRKDSDGSSGWGRPCGWNRVVKTKCTIYLICVFSSYRYIWRGLKWEWKTRMCITSVIFSRLHCWWSHISATKHKSSIVEQWVNIAKNVRTSHHPASTRREKDVGFIHKMWHSQHTSTEVPWMCLVVLVLRLLMRTVRENMLWAVCGWRRIRRSKSCVAFTVHASRDDYRNVH